MKKKLLPWVIALSALSVSVSAAFYSVSGLGKMFAGASMEVMILAGSLEFAKLVAASLLYQYWKKLNLGLKLYLSFATLVLIIITSAGIYGFLSSAYQETSFKVQNQDKNIEIIEKNILVAEREIKGYQTQSERKEKRISQLTDIRTNLQSTQDVLIERSRSTSAVRQQMKDIDSEIKRMDSEIFVLNDSIASKNKKISLLEQQKLEVSSDADLAGEVGPLKYIANLTGSTIDMVVNWYIIVLMIVFDPLAIALVIAANFAFSMNEKKEETKDKKSMKKKDNFLKSIWNKVKGFNTKKENFDHDEKVIETEAPAVNPPVITKEKIDPIQNDLPKVIEIVNEKKPNHVEDPKKDLPVQIQKESDNEVKENKTETEDTYNDEIISENQKIKRDKFREAPDPIASRESFRKTNSEGQNPLNLR
jgi:hypothetical protein